MKEIDEFVHTRCQFCEIPIVVKGPQGKLMSFTKHDDEFCKEIMRSTIEMQQKSIESLNIRCAQHQHSFLQVIREDHEDQLAIENQVSRERILTEADLKLRGLSAPSSVYTLEERREKEIRERNAKDRNE